MLTITVTSSGVQKSIDLLAQLAQLVVRPVKSRLSVCLGEYVNQHHFIDDDVTAT